jgi:hypothetical protein
VTREVCERDDRRGDGEADRPRVTLIESSNAGSSGRKSGHDEAVAADIAMPAPRPKSKPTPVGT